MSTTLSFSAPAYSKRWAALFVLCAAQFMVIMDTSIIGVALPAIQKALGYSEANLQWIFNAYVIFFGGLLLLGGKLSDLFGARKIFITGFGILAAASLLAGTAWSEGAMNAGRALQGFGSALIAPASLTLLMSMFTDPKELTKAFGFWGASAAAGGSAGVFLGGVITEWLSWNWVFLINIPVALAVMLASPSLLLPGTSNKGRVDILGAVLITGALVLSVYTIITGGNAGWLSVQTIAMLLLSIALFVVFIVVQRTKKEPLLPLNIFRRPNLAAGNVVTILLAGAWIPLWFYLNLYLQQVLGYNAFYSGLALLPMTVAIMVLMVGFTGRLVARFGFKPVLVTGMLALVLSLVIFSFVPVNGSFLTNVLPASLIAAAGMSLAYIPVTMSSMSGAKPEETGLASGIVNTTYQIGSAIGLAIVAAIATAEINSGITAGLPQVEAYNSAFKLAFISAGIISAIGTFIAIFYIKAPKAK